MADEFFNEQDEAHPLEPLRTMIALAMFAGNRCEDPTIPDVDYKYELEMFSQIPTKTRVAWRARASELIGLLKGGKRGG